MALQKNHIDRTFREKLKNFSDPAPQEVWEGVTGYLIQDRRRSRLFLFVRIAASVAVIISLGTAYLLLRNPSAINRQAGEHTSIPADTSATVPVTENRQALLSETRETKSAKKGEEFMAAKDNRTGAGNNTRQKTGTNEEIKMSMLRQAVQPEEHNTQAYDLLAVTAMREIQGITSGSAGNDRPDMDRVSILKEKPVYEIAAPSEKPDKDLIVLIDENTEANKIRSDRWAVGTQVSPVYSYRDLGSSAVKTDALSYYNTAESGMLAYAGGVNLSYLTSKRLTVQSGLYYSRMGISIEHSYASTNLGPGNIYSDAFQYSTIANSSGQIRTGSGNIESYYTSGWSGDKTEGHSMPAGETFNQLNLQFNKSEIIQNFQYLEIPVILKYKMIDRRLGFNLLGGMSTNLLLGSNAYLLNGNDKEKIGRTTDLKTVNYSSTVGMGMDYALSSRFNLSLEPFFKYYLNSINQSADIKSRPYTFGVFSGISFVF